MGDRNRPIMGRVCRITIFMYKCDPCSHLDFAHISAALYDECYRLDCIFLCRWEDFLCSCWYGVHAWCLSWGYFFNRIFNFNLNITCINLIFEICSLLMLLHSMYPCIKYWRLFRSVCQLVQDSENSPSSSQIWALFGCPSDIVVRTRASQLSFTPTNPYPPNMSHPDPQ